MQLHDDLPTSNWLFYLEGRMMCISRAAMKPLWSYYVAVSPIHSMTSVASWYILYAVFGGVCQIISLFSHDIIGQVGDVRAFSISLTACTN